MSVFRSHDRALPEIPASASGVASTDDDEEDDEGHYDVISKSRRAAVAANSRPQKPPRFCHPYEIVAGDSDSTYAGIREELEAVLSHRNSRGQTGNSGAAAAVPSDPPYAGIVGDGNRDGQVSAPGVSVRRAVSSTYSAVITNPQLHRLHVADHAAEPDRTSSVGTRTDNDAESPLLPPRNGNIDAVDSGPSAGVTSSVSAAWTQLTAAMSTLSAVAVNSNGPDLAASSASANDPSAHHTGGDAIAVSGTVTYCFVALLIFTLLSFGPVFLTVSSPPIVLAAKGIMFQPVRLCMHSCVCVCVSGNNNNNNKHICIAP